MKIKSIAICMMFALLAIGTVAQATVGVSNMGGTSDGLNGWGIGAPLTIARQFTTGGGTSDWNLASVMIDAKKDTGTSSSLVVSLFSNSGSNAPGTSLATLSGDSPIGSSYTNYTYTDSLNTILHPGTSYWIVLSSDGAGYSYKWHSNEAGSNASTGLTGWTMGTGIQFKEPGDPRWYVNPTGSVRTEINVAGSPAAVPEASTLIGFGSALAMAGPGMIGWLRRRRA